MYVYTYAYIYTHTHSLTHTHTHTYTCKLYLIGWQEKVESDGLGVEGVGVEELAAAGHCLFHHVSLPLSAHITTSSSQAVCAEP
jgi:hypothetical protein